VASAGGGPCSTAGESGQRVHPCPPEHQVVPAGEVPHEVAVVPDWRAHEYIHRYVCGSRARANPYSSLSSPPLVPASRSGTSLILSSTFISVLASSSTYVSVEGAFDPHGAVWEHPSALASRRPAASGAAGTGRDRIAGLCRRLRGWRGGSPPGCMRVPLPPVPTLAPLPHARPRGRW
jgi:hypothetical protein